MKLFISSVRTGLEQERDNLPGLVGALGHEPKRFEDFTAQPMPSREACVRGVQACEGYLLILGERYGEPLPDTGLAPTEEEWNAARTKGMPILAFVKSGMTSETRQAEFIRRVEDYVDGRFRKSFTDASDLMVKAAEAINALASGAPALTFAPLRASLEVPWRQSDRGGFVAATGTILEVHVLPVEPSDEISATVLTGLPKRLARAGRDADLFGEDRALDQEIRERHATVATKQDDRGLVAGITAYDDRRVTIWTEIPRDNLGTIIDRDDVAGRTAACLRLAADLNLSASDQVAIAAGIAPISMVNIGRISDLGHRTSMTMLGFGRSDDYARVEPRDTVPARTLGPAAREIAGELANRLMLRLGEVTGLQR